MYTETAWSFETAQLRVELVVSESQSYEVTEELKENPNLTAFDTCVRVIHKASGVELGTDSLCESIYEDPSEFWTAHRDPNPMARNCEAFRAAHGGNASVCHYFPQMVRMACVEARKRLLALGSIPVRV
jgi:hypothetical protein